MGWSKDGLFGRDNVQRGTWGAAIALVMFFVGKSSGPQKVVLAEPYPERKTENIVPENLKRDLDNLPTKKEIKELATAINNLARVNSENKTERTNSQKRLQELSAEIDRVKSEAAAAEDRAFAKKTIDALHDAYERAKQTAALPASKDARMPASVENPQDGGAKKALHFTMPSSVKGYTEARLTGASAIKCKDEALQPGQKISASFVFNDLKRMDRASPLEVSLVRVRSPNDLLQILHQWSPIQVGANNISVSPPVLDKGRYQMRFGYYLVDEITGEFPKQYGHTCEFSIE